MRNRPTSNLHLRIGVAITSVLQVVFFGIGCRNSPDQITLIDTTKMELGEKADRLPARIPLAQMPAFGQLPDSIKTKIGPKMANPGRPFNEGDVSIPGLPGRRLIFAGAYDQYYLVHYETGGEAHGFVIVLFELSGEQAIPLWAHAGIKFADAAEFEREMTTHRFKNDVDTIFRQ